MRSLGSPEDVLSRRCTQRKMVEADAEEHDDNALMQLPERIAAARFQFDMLQEALDKDQARWAQTQCPIPVDPLRHFGHF